MYAGYRIERRKFKRLNVNLSVLWRVMWPKSVIEMTKGEEFEAQTSNISEGGMALHLHFPLPQDTRLFCKIVIFEINPQGSVDFHQIVVVFSQVRSIIPLEDGTFRVGVCFDPMDHFKKEKILDIIHSPLKYESPSLN